MLNWFTINYFVCRFAEKRNEFLMNGKHKTTTIVTVIISAALLGLITVQVLLLLNTYEQKQQEFNRSVVNALENVSRKIEVNEAVRKITLVAKDTSYLAKTPVRLAKKLETGKKVKKANGKTTVSVVSVTTPGVTGSNYVQEDKIFEHYHSDTLLNAAPVPPVPGKIAFSGATDSSGTHSSYSFSVAPGQEAKVYTSASGTHKFYFESIDTSKRKEIITDVFDQLFITEELPLEQRINRDTLDSLIRAELLQKNIILDYVYGVASGEKDSLLLLKDSSAGQSLLASPLKAALFPADILSPQKNLVIHFPDQDVYVIKQVAPAVLFSLLFLGLLAAAFIYILSVISKQKRLSSHLVDFINNMTHEFKTPISTISLAAEAIGKPEVISDIPKFNRYRSIISDENIRMKSQVDKILQMAVIEGGKAQLEMTNLKLTPLLEEAAANFKVRTDEAGGSIILDLRASKDTISGDKVHISNIIHNLLDNSLKYSNEQPKITITSFNFDKEIVIKISDNGFGIPEKDIPHVFEKYYRVSSGNIHNVKGFGLGLSYVKLMVTAHNGKIALASQPGKGTTITITFYTV